MNMTNTQATADAVDLINCVKRADGSYHFDNGTIADSSLLGIMHAQDLCHGLASLSGWWTDLATGKRKTREQVNVPEKLCLIHSEVSGAMEGDRKDLMDDKLPHRKMLEVELADAMIRILDLAGFLGLDMSGAMIEKLAYNQQRADHKIENRQAENGKAY